MLKANSPTPVEINFTPEQTVESFGASGAWWPNDLNYFPSQQQQNLSQLLFSEEWLYLSGYRYNMGASGGTDTVTISPPTRGVESFMKTDGTYDFTRDGPGMYYLKAAEAANVSSVTFFVNAAPSGLNATLQNLTPCGGSLEMSDIPLFVAYMETVLTYWAENDVYIDYISPMNEPDNSFPSCQQEGMYVDPVIRSEVFQQLRAALVASTSAGAKSVKIMGDETSQIASEALEEYSIWLPQTLKEQSIDAIAVHMYDWPDDAALLNYAQLVKNSSLPNPPPPIRMTEISSFQSASGTHAPYGWTGPKVMGSQYDPTMSNALDMARMIWQWMTLVNAESFDWWTAVSTMLPCSPSTTTSCTTYSASAGWNDALIYIDPNYQTTKNYSFYLTKRFWVFKHFTTFIRPGSVRYDIPNEVLPYGTVAVASLGIDSTWSVVFVNRNSTSQTVTLKMPATGGKVLRMIQTTDTEDWQSMPVPSVTSQDTVLFTLPARGVLSIQFSVSGPLSARQVSGERDTEGDDSEADSRDFDSHGNLRIRFV